MVAENRVRQLCYVAYAAALLVFVLSLFGPDLLYKSGTRPVAPVAGDSPPSSGLQTHPEPEVRAAAQKRRPAEGSTAPAAAATGQTAPASGGGASGGGPLPKLPHISGGQATNFASSIKALNLEPMRAAIPRADQQSRAAQRPQPLERPAAQRLQPHDHAPPSQQASAPTAPQGAQAQQPPQAPEPASQVASQPAEAAPRLRPAEAVAVAPAPTPVLMGAQIAQQAQQQLVQPTHTMMPPQHAAAHMQLHQSAPVVPQVAPAAPALVAADGPKKKGMKLKNAAMARPGGMARADDAKDDRPDDAKSVHTALDLNPPDKVFDKVLMLRIWRATKGDPLSVTTLKASVRPGEKTPTTGDADRRATKRDARPIIGQDYQSRQNKNAKKPDVGQGGSIKDLPNTGKGYKITDPKGREEDIERRVRGLLNKICPDNLKTIVDRLASVDLHKAEELEHVIRIIFSKALAEPHYCETYADMVFSLRTRYPEFPPEHEGEKAHSFTRILLNTCQNEFESLPTSFEPTEEEKQMISPDELTLDIKRKKEKVLANMKFIGNLFLRQLLAVKVIGQVVHDLIGIKDAPIEEHMIECVCELLQAIGFSLDNTQHGKMLVTQFSHRLMDLKKEIDPATGRSLFSKRIQFRIQDLIDLRGRNWVKKLLRDLAKTKEEVRKDAAADARKSAKGPTQELFQTQVAGMRPSYIEELKPDARSAGRRQAQEHSRAQWDQVHVKRCFQYYAEDKKPDDLHDEWLKPQPTKDQAKQGLEWLCEIGFNDAAKEDIIAETIVQLVAQLKIVHWEILKEALSPMLDSLEDLAVDVPTAPKFIHSLFARFIYTCGRDFNPTLLKIMPLRDKEGSDMVWGLLVGILKRLRSLAGPQGASLVRNALDLKEFKDTACRAKQCDPSRVSALFKDAGVQI